MQSRRPKYHKWSNKVVSYLSTHSVQGESKPIEFQPSVIHTETGILAKHNQYLHPEGRMGEKNVINNHRIVSIVGHRFSLALTENGELYSIGDENNHGQLGVGNTFDKDQIQLTKVHGLEGKIVVSAAAGHYHSLCETADGQVYMWGYSAFTQCASAFDKRVPTLVPTVSSIKERIKFSLGGWHSLLLTEHGIYGWGHNDDGRCGIPIRDHLKTPTLIDFPELFIDVVAAAYHSVALTVTNRVVAWGTDYYLTIGNSDTRQDAYSPVYVDFFRGMVVQRIFSSSEAQASMAISNGVVYAWGNNNGGLFTAGTGNTRPTEVKGVNGFNIGNISLLDGRYYVIYATPLDQIYARITKIDKFYDVIVECSKH